jgi:hypothetical protein
MADALGYAASCAVLASFLMRTMVSLRLVAILSNVLFVAFGYIAKVHPVLFLHMALLPINAWRLFVAADAASVPGLAQLTRFRSRAMPRTYALWLAGSLREPAGVYGRRQSAARLTIRLTIRLAIRLAAPKFPFGPATR